MALFLILTKEDLTCLAEAQGFSNILEGFGQRQALMQSSMFKHKHFVLTTYKCLSR